jgi:hypothetical protein
MSKSVNESGWSRKIAAGHTWLAHVSSPTGGEQDQGRGRDQGRAKFNSRIRARIVANLRVGIGVGVN